MPKYSREVIERAHKMFLSGKSVHAISKELQISYPTLHKWKKDGTWEVDKAQNESEAIQIDNFDALEGGAERHIKFYRGIQIKSARALGLDDPNFDVRFRPPDAVRALDIGIRGERAVQQARFSIDFLQKVFNVLCEEIDDEQILHRIAFRFRQIAEHEAESAAGIVV